MDNCSICLDILENPYTLSCNHIFCEKCIIDSITKSTYLCPLCRNEIIDDDLNTLDIDVPYPYDMTIVNIVHVNSRNSNNSTCYNRCMHVLCIYSCIIVCGLLFKIILHITGLLEFNSYNIMSYMYYGVIMCLIILAVCIFCNVCKMCYTNL
jgi:hypothetical protein